MKISFGTMLVKHELSKRIFKAMRTFITLNLQTLSTKNNPFAKALVLFICMFLCQQNLLAKTNTYSSNEKLKNVTSVTANQNLFIDYSINPCNWNTLHSDATFQLISHGRSGELLLNGKWCNAQEIAKFVQPKLHNSKFKIQNLNIYGCEFAKGEKGLQAVKYLENTLHISVSASTNITGKDGDWVLEVGKQKDVIALNNYKGNLQCSDYSFAPITSAAATPTGSLSMIKNSTGTSVGTLAWDVTDFWGAAGSWTNKVVETGQSLNTNPNGRFNQQFWSSNPINTWWHEKYTICNTTATTQTYKFARVSSSETVSAVARQLNDSNKVVFNSTYVTTAQLVSVNPGENTINGVLSTANQVTNLVSNVTAFSKNNTLGTSIDPDYYLYFEVTLPAGVCTEIDFNRRSATIMQAEPLTFEFLSLGFNPPTLNNTPVCNGNTTTLSGNCTNGGTLTWYTTAARTTVLPSTTVTPASGGSTYYATCIKGTGTGTCLADTSSILVVPATGTASSPFVISTTPNCSTNSQTLNIGGLPSGSWTLNQTGTASQTINGSGSLKAITGLLPGSYTFTLNNGCGNSTPLNVTITAPNCDDCDGDGIPNIFDLDDDNDGILDAVEAPTCYYTAAEASAITNVSTPLANDDGTNVDLPFMHDGVTTTVTASNNVITAGAATNGSVVYNVKYTAPVQLTSLTVNGSGTWGTSATAQLEASNDGVNWVSLMSSATAATAATNTFTANQNAAPYLYYRVKKIAGTTTPTFTTYEVNGVVNTTNYVPSANPKPTCSIDTDGDGVLNTCDLDSDGDGCSDAQESGVIGTLLVGTLVNKTVSAPHANSIAQGPYGANGFADPIQKAAAVDSNAYNGTYTYSNALDSTIASCTKVKATPDKGTISSAVGGVVIANIVNNDSIYGMPATVGTNGSATISKSGTWPTGISLDTTTGAVSVVKATTPATYLVSYTICDKSLPKQCVTKVDTVIVTPLIKPKYDSLTVTSNGGGATPNIALGDSVNGRAATIGAGGNATISKSGTWPSGITLDSTTGLITIAKGTKPGKYAVPYNLCDTLNPKNCAVMVDTVWVTPLIKPKYDSLTVTSNGGGAIPNIALGDSVNGKAAVIGAGGNATISKSGTWPTGITLDSLTGLVTVAKGTTPGKYAIPYNLCDTLNPKNCAVMVDTVWVTSYIKPKYDSLTVSSNGGGAIPNIALGDSVNGKAAVIGAGGNATIATSGTWPTGITLNTSSGLVTIAKGTTPGKYAIPYNLCDTLTPKNCAVMVDTIWVTAFINPSSDKGTAPATGGVAISNVAGNDSVNGLPAMIGVNSTIATSGSWPSGITLNTSTGAVSVAGGTTPGTYPVSYNLCDKLTPQTCKTMLDTVIVSPVINPSSDKGTAPATGGVAISNVAGNDSVNGLPATIGVNSTIATSGSWPSGITLNTSTGAVSVAGGTTPGTYPVSYNLCDKLTPQTCKTILDTVIVSPVINPSSDKGTAPATGGVAISNVAGNDSVNGLPATIGVNSTIATSGSWPSGITLNTSTGAVSVAGGTTPGTYPISYNLCDKLTPQTCKTMLDTVIVSPVINPSSDKGTAPATGGVAISNVAGNDSVNGLPATIGVNSTIATSGSWQSGITLNTSTGAVSVAGGTTPGTYPVSYNLCDKLTPQTCKTMLDTLIITPVVSAKPDTGSIVITGGGGIVINNISSNDSVNGVPASLGTGGNSILTPIGTWPAGITVDSLGKLRIATSVPLGTYSVSYRLCDKLSPTQTCITTTVFLRVRSNPLPVELLSFEAKLNESNTVSLDWKTATEINNNKFEVERSTDAKNFTVIGVEKTQATDGNSTEILSYMLLDKTPENGINYYRLHQFDNDGTNTYSAIQSVEIKSVLEQIAISVYPNPTANVLYFNSNNLPEVERIFIVDLHGKEVGEKRLEGTENYLNLADLPASEYEVVFQLKNGKKISKKILKN